MKLTTKKLRQIIREEVTEAFNYGPDGQPTESETQSWVQGQLDSFGWGDFGLGSSNNVA